MGQTIGKLPTESSFSPFVNLPKSVVSDLRCAVMEVSESGYSITRTELEQVIQLSLHEYLSDEKIFEYSNDLFRLFSADALPGSDCDEIDSFELLGTLCLTSGMSLEEKVAFFFDLFDLNEKEELSINEVTLAFRSLILGARKIAIDEANVTNEDIDQVALEAFDLITPESLKHSLAMTDDQKLTKQQFCDYVFNCPEAESFINSYDDIVIGRSSNIDTAAASANDAQLQSNTDEQVSKEQLLSQPWRDQQRFLKPDKGEGDSPPPMDGLRLEHVCGRNSGTEAVYTSEGDVLYAAGSMVIKLIADDDGYKQECFNEHSNRVSSIAIFQGNDGMGDTVASSDTGGDDCKVCVWSSHSLSSQVTFSTRHKVSRVKLFEHFFSSHIPQAYIKHVTSERCVKTFLFTFW
jgi:Ca2+-binding EF-hand superfamily protein